MRENAPPIKIRFNESVAAPTIFILILFFSPLCIILTPSADVPAGSPSRGGHVMVYVTDVNQPNLPTPFYSVLVSVSVFMAL